MPDATAVAKVGAAVLRDRLTRKERPRVPEPMVMDDAQGVAAFHTVDPVLQLPAYRVNAEAMSRLLPRGGRVLDLGSGSGQLVAHLAEARPDVHITATDLSGEMLDTAAALLRRRGIGHRVELRTADMTDLGALVDGRFDLVSSAWALHHLPDAEHLERCLGQVAEVRARSGCAVWLFDFARLRHEDTFAAFFRLSPGAPEHLRRDGIASERAAWSFEELRAALRTAGLGDLDGGRERTIGHFQCHFALRRDGAPDGHDAWVARPLPRTTETFVRRLRAGMPSPQRSVSRGART